MTSTTMDLTGGPLESSRSSAEENLAVAISGSARSESLLHAAKRLADALETSWEAIHIETPEADRESARGRRAAEVLSVAAKLGATIVTLPAGTVAAGLMAYLEDAPVRHLVIGSDVAESSRWRRSLFEVLAAREDGLMLHVCTAAKSGETHVGPAPSSAATRVPLQSYGYAVAAVGGTLLVSVAAQIFLGSRPLDLLFLFPVIAVAARLGLRPALLAVALSVICYNYFLLLPAYSFNAMAPQNLVMTGVLVGVAIYTSVLTTRMRGRLVLSDRSARENASVATLAQKLTRDADWETTALTICDHVNHLLKVDAVVYREVEGTLTASAALPEDVRLGPVDRAALDWTWANGEEAGAGTATLSAADWQFQPLTTSLGILAVLGLAREDGRDPIRADQKILLQTLVAQSSLAHERLRLEDQMRHGAAGIDDVSTA